MKAQDLMEKVEECLSKLGDQVEKAKSSVEVLEYLKFMSRFHKYSFHNSFLIWLHFPQATQVAGFRTWQKLGRFVKKGEKGIPILAPCSYKETVTDEDGEEEEIRHTYFRVVYVFDVSQTDGEPLVEAPITASGDGNGLLPNLEQLARDKGIGVEYRALSGSHHGTSFGGRIEVDNRLDGAGKVAVIIHELAHELLHKGSRDLGRQQKEIEAEAVSFVVCSNFGIDSAAPNYLALWGSDKEKIAESFQRVHQVVVEIIQSLESDHSQVNLKVTAAR